MKTTARFRVRHRGLHWIVCLPLNYDAKKILNGKMAAMRPVWSWGTGTPSHDEEKMEILRKTEALCMK